MQNMSAETHRFESWDDLRFFLAVAREGSLSAAARRLSVNQSTVFRRVEHLLFVILPTFWDFLTYLLMIRRRSMKQTSSRKKLLCWQ